MVASIGNLRHGVSTDIVLVVTCLLLGKLAANTHPPTMAAGF